MEKLVKAFKVFKKGMTNDWVTILCMPTEIESKKQKYLSLGYEVKTI